MTTGTDRELLELAAKAVGSRLRWRKAKLSGVDHEGLYDPKMGHFSLWNPLTDDADALRLAVKLSISFGEGAGTGLLRVAYHLGGNLNTIDVETERSPYEQPIDPVSATRRAIVRAAADIGRSMK